MECQNLYNQLPRIHDIIIGLVEKGDTDLLQKGDTCYVTLGIIRWPTTKFPVGQIL